MFAQRTFFNVNYLDPSPVEERITRSSHPGEGRYLYMRVVDGVANLLEKGGMQPTTL
jgi:hypothetical protein